MQRSIFQILSVLLILSDSTVYSQISFQRTYGGLNDDEATGIIESFDGGYVICGFTKSFGAGNNDAFLIKTDQYGNTLWTRLYGGIKDDIAFSVIQTSDSGFAIAGHTASFGAGEEDLWLIRTNKLGDTLWTRTYGAAHEEYGFSVVQTFDKGFILAGGHYSNVSLADPFVVKTDSIGTLIWSKSFKGNNWDYAFSALAQNSANGANYLVAGTASGTVDLASYAPFLIMLDEAGDTLWTKRYFDDQDDYGIFDYWGLVSTTTDGGFLLAGSTGTYYEGYVLLKLDMAGDYEWIKGYGDSGFTGLERLQGAVQTTDGGFVLSGYCDSFGSGGYDLYVVKTDSTGNVEWSQTYGGVDDETRGIIRQTSDGGYLIAGTIESFGAGQRDIYLVKTDALGISGCNETAAATVTTPIISNVHSGVSPLSPATTSGTSAPEISMMPFESAEICLTTHGWGSQSRSYGMNVFPNPFSISITISFSAAHSRKVSLKIFDLQGRLVRTLANEQMSEGVHTLNWNAQDENGNAVSEGIYFLRMETEDEVKTIAISVAR